jgi:hypothetical protein
VSEDYRKAAAGLLVIDSHAIVGGKVRHRSIRRGISPRARWPCAQPRSRCRSAF